MTSTLRCDDCGKTIVVLNKAIGANCVISLCTVCAKANISTHDQEEYDDMRGCPSESMVVGVRIANVQV